VVRARANPGDVEQLLLNTATQDGKRVTIGFGQDPGQAGKSQAQHLVRALSGFISAATSSMTAALRSEACIWQCNSSLLLKNIAMI
jgi:phage terminase large subunit-like protein